MADRNEDFNWYRGPRRPLESAFLLSFLFSPPFLLSLPLLQHPSPTFRERFTETAYNVTAFAEVTYLHEVDTREVLQKIVRRRTWCERRAERYSRARDYAINATANEKQ